MRPTCSVARLLASAAVTALLAAGLGGCQSMSDITGSISTKPDTSANADPQRAAETYGDRYRANPRDPDAALAYGPAPSAVSSARLAKVVRACHSVDAAILDGTLQLVPGPAAT